MKDIYVTQLDEAHIFQYIIETIFSRECKLNSEFFKIENRILEQFEIEKKNIDK